MTIANSKESRKTGISKSLSDLCQKCRSYKSLKINWAWVAFFSFFITYGYYGALAPSFGAYKSNFVASLGFLVLLCVIQVVFGWAAWKKSGCFADSVSVSVQDVLVCISFLLIGLVFSHERLQYSLYSDEISYAGSAHGHSIFIATKLAKILSEHVEVTSQYLVQAISLILLSSLVALFYFSLRWTPKTRITFFVILLLLVRIVFALKGGNGSPHPPLHLVPLFISGSLMGIGDLSFKISYFFTYAILQTILCKMLFRVFPWSISYVATLAIGTIPLLIYMSTVVEHSFWAFFCFSLVFVEMITSPKLNYPRLITFVSVMALMRQPSFLALVPILLLYVIDSCRTKAMWRWLKESLVIFLPLLLFLPVLLSSLLYGTPSTDALGHGSMLERVNFAVESGIVWRSVFAAFPIWWLSFIPFAFLPLSNDMKRLNAGLLLFGVTGVGVYYSINPDLWGFAKYQAEYAAPIFIAGFLLLMVRFKKFKRNYYQLLLGVTVLVFFNIRELLEHPHLKQKTNSNAEANYDSAPIEDDLKHIFSAVPYEYKKAYGFIKDAGLEEVTFSIGATYGILPEIMNGYSLDAVQASYDIYVGQELAKRESIRLGDVLDLVDLIDRDNRIEAVMLGAVPNKKHLIENFSRKKWVKIAEFENMRYGTNIVIFRRPDKFKNNN